MVLITQILVGIVIAVIGAVLAYFSTSFPRPIDIILKIGGIILVVVGIISVIAGLLGVVFIA